MQKWPQKYEKKQGEKYDGEKEQQLKVGYKNGTVNKTKITQVVISIQDSIQTCQTLLSIYIYIFKIKYKTLDRKIIE